MKKVIRSATFKWRRTEPELILCAVRWYLRYSLSSRDVEELLSTRGLEADYTTIWRYRLGKGAFHLRADPGNNALDNNLGRYCLLSMIIL